MSAPPLRLLDSDILIDLKREVSAAIAWFSGIDTQTLAVPGFVAMEMVQSARNAAEVRSADFLLRSLVRVWPSPSACEAAYADFRTLHLSHSLGLVDALIGATARELNAPLCTFNVKHYRAIPGLVIEQPYTR